MESAGACGTCVRPFHCFKSAAVARDAVSRGGGERCCDNGGSAWKAIARGISRERRLCSKTMRRLRKITEDDWMNCR